jgi:anti-anti-sigma factor
MRLVIVRQPDNVCLVRALGEIDLETVPDLDLALTQIQREPDTSVLLDLWDATYIDSIGIGVLLSARRRAHAHRCGFAVVAEPEGLVRRVFDAAGISGTLPVYATRDLARTTFRASLS